MYIITRSGQTKRVEDTTEQGYVLRLKKWAQQKGQFLHDQRSYHNLSVYNTKGVKHDIARLYPKAIGQVIRWRDGTVAKDADGNPLKVLMDSRRHTIFSNPAYSVAAGFERLWFYERVASGTLVPEKRWWIDYIKDDAHRWARNHRTGSLDTSFRTCICAFTPPTDKEGSPKEGTEEYEKASNNDPNKIVNKITENLDADGFDFDPDYSPFSVHFSNIPLMMELAKDWAIRESAIIWDDRIFHDGAEIFFSFVDAIRNESANLT